MGPIPIENELKAFKEHLDINERTIFSAKFGDGKTFFLNEFKKEYSDENKKKVDKKEKYYFITYTLSIIPSPRIKIFSNI